MTVDTLAVGEQKQLAALILSICKVSGDWYKCRVCAAVTSYVRITQLVKAQYAPGPFQGEASQRTYN